MNPLRRLGKEIQGWLPKEPAATDSTAAPRPWWWQPTWSMGVFVAEVTILNLIVPVSTFGLPLFLANMWLCFLVGWALADRIGKMRNYQSLPQDTRWKTNMRRFVIFPLATAEFAIGVAYFSVDNWKFVLANCWTGNACTLFQLAPVLLLPLGAGALGALVIIELVSRLRA